MDIEFLKSKLMTRIDKFFYYYKYKNKIIINGRVVFSKYQFFVH